MLGNRDIFLDNHVITITINPRCIREGHEYSNILGCCSQYKEPRMHQIYQKKCRSFLLLYFLSKWKIISSSDFQIRFSYNFPNKWMDETAFSYYWTCLPFGAGVSLGESRVVKIDLFLMMHNCTCPSPPTPPFKKGHICLSLTAQGYELPQCSTKTVANAILMLLLHNTVKPG